MRNSPNRQGDVRGAEAQAGFIMPFVLVSIAAMSLVAAASFAAISRASAYMSALEAQTRAEWALMNAEAEIAFAYLSGAPVRGGVYVGSEDFETYTDGAGEVVDGRMAQEDVWFGRGGMRRVSTRLLGDALVAYQDASGLAALNALTVDEIEQVLVAAGAPTATAASFAAKILDYRDPDSLRRFQGGESADYRLAQRGGPANSPLRSIEELGWVLEAESVLTEPVWRALMAYATAGGGVSGMSAAFAPPALAPVVAARPERLGGARDPIRDTAATNRFPSTRARFSIVVVDGNLGNFERIVELERSADAIDKPFRRYWVEDRVTNRTVDQAGAAAPRLGAAQLSPGG